MNEVDKLKTHDGRTKGDIDILRITTTLQIDTLTVRRGKSNEWKDLATGKMYDLDILQYSVEC